MALAEDVVRASTATTGDESRRRRFVPKIAGCAFLLIGILRVGDFGIPWDENLMHIYGDLLLKYFATGDMAWQTYWYGFQKNYGPVVDIPQAIIDRLAPQPY